MKSRLCKISIYLFCLVFCSAQVFAQTDQPPDDVGRESVKFARVYAAIQQNYMDPVNPDKTIGDGGIRGMLAVLDPFSAFFNRQQFELLKQQARGEALGFGSILYVQPGKVLVLQAAPGSPSWRAGLGPGDEIVEVNGTRVDRLDFQSLIRLLQRSRSHPVRLEVIHAGSDVPKNCNLVPEQMALPTVDRFFMFSPRIGYIHLTGFEDKTPQEVANALRQLGGKNLGHLKGVLLDLRGNHGGMVDAAVGVLSLFLKPGLVALTIRGRSMPQKTYRTTKGLLFYSGPLIVLVNNETASAAEVVTAALEEHDRALIAGEPTFGKGVVESVMGLSEKTGLALITAQYFTPSGRSIQRPLPGTALAHDRPGLDTTLGKNQTFHTDDGRPVLPGGGITPDVRILPRTLDPWATFLEQRGLFTDFASNYLTLNGKVKETFNANAKVMSQFKDFLTTSGIRVPAAYWNEDQDYLKLRIKTEIFNLVFGLSKGEEVQVRGDPQVQKAAKLFAKLPGLLKPSTPKSATPGKGDSNKTEARSDFSLKPQARR